MNQGYDLSLSHIFKTVIMPQEPISSLSAIWKSICDQYQDQDLLLALQFIQQHLDALVKAFYEQMLLEPESAEFFTDQLIQQRLIDTLKAWLLETFRVAMSGEYIEAVKRQQKVGAVHARVGIPSWLIMRGVRDMDKTLFALIPQHERAQRFDMMSYIVQLMAFSTEIMCRTYEAKTVTHQEVKHNYRLFSAMQDVAVHKDRQRSSLLDWENELMFKIFAGNTQVFHPLFSKSEFGLWFIHKAAYAFTGAEQVDQIIERIYAIDHLTTRCLALEDKQQVMLLVQNIRNINREIQHLIDQLFQVAEYIESGNDALTQLLNRRYLNTIVAREINYARKHNSALSLLALDADFFKTINDRYGHAAGDLAIKFIAETLQKYSKGSDYVFRVGGEEFLLLLVDSDLAQSRAIAEKIRYAIECEVLQAEQHQFSLTISIGCAIFDGHPDYEKFLDAADHALYAAKNNGRNCTYVSEAHLQAGATRCAVNISDDV